MKAKTAIIIIVFGSLLVLVGFWNVITMMVGDESYFKNIVCVCFGMLLWVITNDITEVNGKVLF